MALAGILQVSCKVTIETKDKKQYCSEYVGTGSVAWLQPERLQRRLITNKCGPELQSSVWFILLHTAPTFPLWTSYFIHWFLKEKVTPKHCTFFVNFDKNFSHSLANFTQWSAGFRYEIRLQRNPKFDILAAILNSTQQGCVFVTSFGPRDLVQMASDKPLKYHTGFWLLLNWRRPPVSLSRRISSG